jgi:hypothetical protein
LGWVGLVVVVNMLFINDLLGVYCFLIIVIGVPGAYYGRENNIVLVCLL